MTNSNECTCPSGDGSLRHPCPAHSNKNELKVGDVVSMRLRNFDCRDNWLYGHLTHKGTQYITMSGLMITEISDTQSWQRGIHPSLIPDGFCLSKIEDSETQHSLSIENTSLRKELEAARKEILRLSNLINEHNNLCLTCQELGDHFDSDTWVIKAAPKPAES